MKEFPDDSVSSRSTFGSMRAVGVRSVTRFMVEANIEVSANLIAADSCPLQTERVRSARQTAAVNKHHHGYLQRIFNV